jgi:Glutamate-cysteine ligase family 2(GCS2)
MAGARRAGHHRPMLAFRPRTRRAPAPADPGGWAATAAPWSVALTEQAMVLDPARWALVEDVVPLVAALPPGLTRTVGATERGRALELRTGPHATVGEAVAALGSLRGRLTAALGRSGLRAAAASSHPEADATFALHVAVAVPDLGRATLAHDRLRNHLPVLLALSANSPFLDGRETGLSSARGDALQTRRPTSRCAPTAGWSRSGSSTRRRACATRARSRRSSRALYGWRRRARPGAATSARSSRRS